jgi:2-amino-4-hydroxy-6-hydroxymethyldihydropteridine diphosphokinase
MPEVYVAAGSNIRPRTHLRRALAELHAAYPDLRVSPAYSNRAVGFEGDDFINLVVGFDTDEPLDALLARLHAVEERCGRPRNAPKWAPRSLDLDVLLYGDHVGEFPGAILPRPDLVRRPYMLGPLAALAPDARHPVLGERIGDLWARFDRAGHELVQVSLEGED